MALPNGPESYSHVSYPAGCLDNSVVSELLDAGDRSNIFTINYDTLINLQLGGPQ